MACLAVVEWDCAVPHAVLQCCNLLLAHLQNEDPVHGVWSPPGGREVTWTLWCDASSTAISVLLEADGEVMEDRCWLRPDDDRRHINVAELDGAV